MPVLRNLAVPGMRVTRREGADAASLNQLKRRAAPSGAPAAAGELPEGGEAAASRSGAAAAGEELPEGFEALPHAVGPDDELTGDERKVLEAWINPAYLGRKAERQLVAQWEASSCAELRGFLRRAVADEVRSQAVL